MGREKTRKVAASAWARSWTEGRVCIVSWEGGWNFPGWHSPGWGLVEFQVQNLDFLHCMVGQSSAIRAVRAFCGWNLAFGGPQGRDSCPLGRTSASARMDGVKVSKLQNPPSRPRTHPLRMKGEKTIRGFLTWGRPGVTLPTEKSSVGTQGVYYLKPPLLSRWRVRNILQEEEKQLFSHLPRGRSASSPETLSSGPWEQLLVLLWILHFLEWQLRHKWHLAKTGENILRIIS